jgi:hypothetical protein
MIASGDNDELKLTMPRYLTRLPVSTWNIICARMSYGIASSLILALTFTTLFYALFDSTMERELPFTTFLVIWPVTYVLVQAVVWCVGPAGVVATLALVGFEILVLRLAFGFDGFNVENYSPQEVAIVILVSAITSIVFLDQYRKGRFTEASWAQSFARSAQGEGTDLSETFASKKKALRWFQYREVANLFPKLVVLISILSCLLHLAFNRQEIPPGYIVALTIYWGSVSATVLVGIVALFRGWSRLMKKDGAFLLTRPATTMDLIAARWEANAKAVVMTIIPVMLAAAIVFLTPQTLYTDDPAYENVNYFAYMSEQLSGGLVILMVVAAVISLCIAMWALLWIENIMGLCGIGAVVAIVFASLGHLAGFEPDDLEAPGFVTATILITATTMLLAAVAKRKNLLNTKYLILLLALIPVIGVGVLMSTQGNALVGQYPIDKNSFLIALPLVMSVVVAPIITGPLLMDWVRHKR